MRFQQDLLLNAEMAGHGLSYHVVPKMLAEHERHRASTLGKTDAIERHRWFLELCRRMARMPEQYHTTVARKAAWHAARLYGLGDVDGMREGLQVADRMGLEELPGGRLVGWLSRTFGLEAGLRYRIWRA